MTGNSARHHDHHRDFDLIEFTESELVDRYRTGQPLSRQQQIDAERVINAQKEAP